MSSMVKELLSSRAAWLLTVLFLYLLYGLHSYFFKQEINNCEMTYMYQFPQFIPVDLNSQIAKKFPNYHVYMYGEGEYAEFLSDGALFGVPVLFVPGSGGSYKQVRSIGSVALRMAEDKLLPHHLNFFTIDFNEELSALYGSKLVDQTEFLYEAITAIRRLYSKPNRNVSLIIIGHSIGGLISRGVFLHKNFDPKFVDLLITLAAPHKRPAVYFDNVINSYYHKTNQFWRSNRKSSDLSHLTIISIGGGFHDKLVKSELTQFEDLTPSLGDTHLVTTSIPDVWLSTDHQCIVWCRQLVLKLTKFLFEIIDAKKKRVEPDIRRRMYLINHHLLNRNRGSSANQAIPTHIEFPERGSWVSHDERFFAFRRVKQVIEPTYIMIPLVPKTNVVLVTSNILRSDWLFACNATLSNIDGVTKKICDVGENLTPYTRLVHKTNGAERKLFKYDSNRLISSGHNHLVAYIGPTSGAVSILGERFSVNKRNKAIMLPSILQGVSFWSTPSVVLEIPIADESIFHNLTLVGLNQVWHCYVVRVEVTSCYNSAYEHGLVHFWVPWSREDQINQIAPVKGKFVDINLRLNIPKKNSKDSRHPHLYLMLDPNCGYTIKMKLSDSEVLIQIIRHYFNVFYPLLSAIMLSAFSLQIIPESKQPILESISNGNGAFFKNQGRIVYLPLSCILRKNFLKVSIYGLLPFLPVIIQKAGNISTVLNIQAILDSHSLGLNHLSFDQLIFLTAFLYLLAYSFIFCVSVLLEFIILILSSPLSFLNSRKLLKFPQEPSTSSRRFAIFLMLVNFVITCITCTTVGIAVLIVIVILKTIHVSSIGRLIETRQGQSEKTTVHYVFCSLILLLLIALVPSIPESIIWYRDYFMRTDGQKNFTDSFFSLFSLIIIAMCEFFRMNSISTRSGSVLCLISVLFKIEALLGYSLGLMSYEMVFPIVSLCLLSYAACKFFTPTTQKMDLKKE